MNRHSILFSVLLSGAYAHAQPNPRIDSLLLRLNGTGPSTARVDLLIRLAFETADQHMGTTRPYWEEAATLSNELHYATGEAYAPMAQVMENYAAGRYPSAITGMKESIEKLDALGAEQDLSSPLSFIRIAYNAAGLQEERFAFYQEALARYERTGPVINVGTCHHGLAGYYMTVRQYAGAIEHYMKAREIFRAHRPEDVPNETMVIGWAYERWGNPARAIPYLEEALAAETQRGNEASIAELTLHLGDNELELGRTSQALRYYAISRTHWHVLNATNLAIFRARYILAMISLGRMDNMAVEYDSLRVLCTNNPVPLASNHGVCEADYCGYAFHRATGSPRAADSCLHRALVEALRLKELPLILKYRKAWIERYTELGDQRNAALQSQAYIQLNDSLQREANNNAVAAYEGQAKERESAIELQRQQARLRQQRIVLVAAAIGVALLIALAYAVNKGRKLSDALLHNILPEEVARELKRKGHADAKHFTHATILFTDFKGFTEASERMTPQELVEELNTCFKAFDGIITARKIEKIKTIGDAYMCVGGLPDPSTTAPVDVVLAALEMQAFMIARGIAQEALGKPSFEMRVGIHTGPVVAGIVGVKKFAYDIWGDTVNIASRMESSGEVGQVNISESTYAMVHDTPDLTFTSRGKIQAKGKGEMEMYFAARIDARS